MKGYLDEHGKTVSAKNAPLFIGVIRNHLLAVIRNHFRLAAMKREIGRSRTFRSNLFGRAL